MTMAADRPGPVDAILDRLQPPPAAAWAYGLRIWVAMMLALYVAFWLQLESASSAAVCVAILAQPQRGQALSKAFYRMIGTGIGFVVSVVLAALFGQDRVLMLIAFTTWLGLCAFVSGYRQGTQAYGAVLAGYTVAIVAIAHLDRPLDVFEAGLARVAAITVGILSVALVNDLFAAPSAYAGLRDGLGEVRAGVLAYMRRCLRDGDPGPEDTAALLRRIAGAGAGIAAVARHFDEGHDRAAGARSVVAALFAQVAAARALAVAIARDGRGAQDIARRAEAGLDGDPAAAEADLRAAAARAASPEAVLLHLRAADLLRQEVWIRDGDAALAGGRPPARRVTLPVHRDFPDAALKAVQAVFVVAVSAALFILSGWPGTSTGLLQIAAFAGILAINPAPGSFALGAMIGTPLAAACAGIVEFLVVVDGQGFPLLAIAMAPVVFAGCLLSLGRRTGSHGFILLVFFPVLLAPANPQPYDPQAFVDAALLFGISGVVAYLSVRATAVRDATRRSWSLGTLRRSLCESLTAEPDEASLRPSLNGERLARFSALRTASDVAHRSWLRHALALAALDTAAAGAQAGLNRLLDWPGTDGAVDGARAALRRLDPDALRDAAADLLATGRPGAEPELAEIARGVAADLMTASHVAASEARSLRRLDPAQAA
ncbi:FUSC family protein [uncultured Methylobacterium sp.]|jgi:uncharacterized membrane protein YccC|uniref:FUSC family protein n=1 Tax=uncultured Methylobacterium sp. TaxID=157278 RepID=UPI00263750E0|nr:FUSC family protein [uncultured Methylobacterium sp.]